MFARLLNGMFGEGKKGETRRQKIDGRELPEYRWCAAISAPPGCKPPANPTAGSSRASR